MSQQEKDKDKITDPAVKKVIIFVTQFGNGIHIPVSPKWIGRGFLSRGSRSQKKNLYLYQTVIQTSPMKRFYGKG
jgi:hypothetical protein